MHESHCPEIGTICDERDEPPQLHDQRFNILELRLTAEYAFTDTIGLEVQAPLKVNRTDIEYQRLDGTAFTPDYPNIHHRNETLVGPGDPWLLARLARDVAGFSLSGRAGLSIPLGSTEENPFVRGEMGLEHQHIQFGTGTFDPVFALLGARRFHDHFEARVQTQAQLTLYENGHGYRAGNRYAVGVAGRMSLGDRWSVGLTTDVVTERPERWDGEILQDGNLGRMDVLMGAGATARVADYSVSAAVRVPVYQDIVQAGDEAAQLSYPAIVELGIMRSFELRGDR